MSDMARERQQTEMTLEYADVMTDALATGLILLKHGRTKLTKQGVT